MYLCLSFLLCIAAFQVCKHFLHAIEKAIYGWFWECPNSERCIYRHALPSGFVFKKIGSQILENDQVTITIEELVDKEVHGYIYIYIHCHMLAWPIYLSSSVQMNMQRLQ